MPDRETQAFRLALESVRPEIVAAVRGWRDGGGRDDDLVLYVDLLRPGAQRVSTTTRRQLELTIPDFDPSIPIEIERTIPGKAPAVVDIHDHVRRVIWIDLTPPFSW